MQNQQINLREKYRLSDAQIASIKQRVISVLAKNIRPSKNPLAIVVGGQSGSGKTALINYTTKVSSKRKFIQIDNDFFRDYHPAIKEIKKLHPDDYVTATDQLGLGITADIIDYFRQNHYDIILHQTLKNNRVVDDAITKFIEAGYTVGVRAFAVPYFESKMSQIERCEGQIETLGFCRFVAKEDHDTAMIGLPKTVGYIEQSGKYDFIEIYKRGKLIDAPEVVYTKFNPRTKAQTLNTLADCENIALVDHDGGFANAEDAVVCTRASEAKKCAETLPERISAAERSVANNAEMQMHIDELKDRLRDYQQSQDVKKKLVSCLER